MGLGLLGFAGLPDGLSLEGGRSTVGAPPEGRSMSSKGSRGEGRRKSGRVGGVVLGGGRLGGLVGWVGGLDGGRVGCGGGVGGGFSLKLFTPSLHSV